MVTNTKKRVGILRGGMGADYASSLKEGGNIIAHIYENLKDKYKPVDILIDKGGVWHFGGIPVQPADLMHKVDVVWNTSHSSLNIILENFSIPNVGAGSSLLENNCAILEGHLRDIGIKMPRHIISPKNAKEVHQKFPAPWITKFQSGVKIIKTFNELHEVINNGDVIMVEEFIEGIPGAVHSVAGFRGDDVYTFPPTGFTREEKAQLISLAKNLHSHLGAEHYLKSDFILTPRRGIYITNIDFSPDLRQDSHFDDACIFVGAKMHQVVEHMLEQALN